MPLNEFSNSWVYPIQTSFTHEHIYIRNILTCLPVISQDVCLVDGVYMQFVNRFTAYVGMVRSAAVDLSMIELI